VLSYTDRPVVCSHIQTDWSCALIYRQTGHVLSYADRPVVCSHIHSHESSDSIKDSESLTANEPLLACQ